MFILCSLPALHIHDLSLFDIFFPCLLEHHLFKKFPSHLINLSVLTSFVNYWSSSQLKKKKIIFSVNTFIIGNLIICMISNTMCILKTSKCISSAFLSFEFQTSFLGFLMKISDFPGPKWKSCFLLQNLYILQSFTSNIKVMLTQ